jgi:molybdopterin molybdotransferase
MTSVSEALDIILAHRLPSQFQRVLLDQTLGKTLAEVIVADRDFPPFNRVTMDGIAIDFAHIHQKQWQIESTQLAGETPHALTLPHVAIEVMTGAVLPTGTNTIIRYEDLDITENEAGKVATLQIPIDQIIYQQNVHKQGSDRREGDVLIERNRRISAAEIAVMASVGKTNVVVYKTPAVAIISTGDELVGIDQTPLPHQIRRSNSYMVQAALAKNGIDADLYHLLDDVELLTGKLMGLLAQYDVLILSGGVSEGKADFIPKVLTSLGVTKHFHKVAQRPGKPFWFGTRATDGKVVFALPGNPVSTFVCTCKYVLPALNKQASMPKAVLSEQVIFKPSLTYFLPVSTRFSSQGQLMAKPLAGGGSGDFANLLDCDGFLQLPADKTLFEAGEVFDFIGFR